MGQPHAYLWGWSPARLWGCQRCCIWSWSRGSHAGSASPRRRTGRNPCTGQLWGPCSGLFWQLGSRIGEMNSTDCPGISGILRTLEELLGKAHSHTSQFEESFFLLKNGSEWQKSCPRAWSLARKSALCSPGLQFRHCPRNQCFQGATGNICTGVSPLLRCRYQK